MFERFTLLAVLMGAGVALAADAPAQPQQSPVVSLVFVYLVPITIMFGVMYLLMIRPQQKKERERLAMLDALRKNDRIVTIGGIHGTVSAIKGEEVHVKVAENVVLRFSKSAVARVVAKGEAEESDSNG